MTTPLEQFVVNVQNLSSSGNFTQLHTFVSKSSEVLLRNASHLEDVLATLDLQKHSLGVLAILCVKFSFSTPADYEALYAQVQEFITSCNGEQVRFATDMFAELCHLLAQSLVERQQPMRGIYLLTRAISKIQLFPSQLTSIHADLCQLCLLAKCLKPALQFLDIDITDISRENDHYDAKHFLLYFYYGGMIYTALKNYERALYFFEVAITTTSMAVSHIMMEAYKKYILVSLILYGKVPSLPKYTSQVVSRFIKPLSQPYLDLAAAYTSNNPDQVRAILSKHAETYSRDNNTGLAKQCLAALYKKNIQRLTKTFLTLSLADMANRVQLSGPTEAERYIFNMIEEEDIFASINQKDGMVVFLDNPEKYNTPHMFKRLEEEMRKFIQLNEKLKQMDQEIAVDPKYIQKCSGQQEDDQPGSTKIPSYSI
ncbi:COP9 signalosome complex subunit 3-like [Ornithodoros turicata]|uniref:COP9 signalosome complex subunit 3 n=1 Tax=Ornithodoros turicata TaxID=34597 RepID=A0A2R5LBI0_9ACAR